MNFPIPSGSYSCVAIFINCTIYLFPPNLGICGVGMLGVRNTEESLALCQQCSRKMTDSKDTVSRQKANSIMSLSLSVVSSN